MSHRLALTLSLFLTIAFAGLVVLERGALFGAPSASDSAIVGSVPSAAPALSDASLPANGLVVSPGQPSGIAEASSATRDDAPPIGFGPAPVDAAPAVDDATTSQIPRADRRHHRADNDAAAQGGDDE